jgi:hypothetical protein
MATSTVHLSAGMVMDDAAALMNDPAKTDYTYVSMLPYLNMAIEELNQILEESNIAMTNQVSPILTILMGDNQLYNPPIDIIEIQEVGERLKGTNDSFVPLPRREFTDIIPISSSLLFWCWKNQKIYFNPNGANTVREVQLKYTSKPISRVQDEFGLIENSNTLLFLAYKTAALCSMFVGENQTRAGILEEQSVKALERIEGISNKGRQQIMTRHRPFRASYKARGY